ncbi:MAG: N-acetylmuramoyl-L-alanine amidase family protein [Bacteroidota bacterium]
MKRKIIIFGILFLVLSVWQYAHADRYGFVRKVVIDPGHGGRDPGAEGSRSKEKDIVLSIALKLGGYIEENFTDVEVIYTRTTDEFVELHRRAQIANENKADLFISLHCNGHASSHAYGSETFVMGLHKSQENLQVAKKENASILYEEDYLETYDGYDPNSEESNIIFNMFQNTHLNQSLKIASLVQDQFRERAMRVDRGVKQAGFIVLYRVTMPGILVEAGFLSNRKEEEFLMSDIGQSYIASAIFRAFRDYKTMQDQMASKMLVYNNGNHQQTIPESENQIKHDNQENKNGNTSVDSGNNGNKIDSAETSAETNHDQNSSTSNPVISFRVQFATTSEKKQPNDPFFTDLEGVSYYEHQGLYKYTLGNESTLEAASKIQKELHEKGFTDAFVVAFKNNERITPAEAMRLIRESTKMK